MTLMVICYVTELDVLLLIGEEVNNAFETYHFDFIGGTISYGRQWRRFLGTDGSIECCDSINEYTKVLVSKDTNIDLSIWC